MTFIRPNHTIIFDLDERLATEETKLELKRCYTFIGTPLIRSHAAQGDDAPVVNTVRILVSVGTSEYLDSGAEGADALWTDAVDPSIRNMLQKIGANAKAFNRRQRKIGLPPVDVHSIEFELGGGALTVALRPDPTSCISRDLHEMVDLARTLRNDGTFAGAVRVEVPSAASYAAQSSAAEEAWDAEQAARAEADARAEAQAAGREPSAEELEEARLRKMAEQSMADKGQGIKRFFDDEWLGEDAERKSYENTAVAPVDSDDLPPAYHLPEEPEPDLFDFDVDYTVWGVVYEDGTKREFDSAMRTFVE